MRIYTDGSGFEGQVGAAAILRRDDKPDRTMTCYLGTLEEHTVYEGEVAGLLMAAELLRTETEPFDWVAVGTDNQASLGAPSRFDSHPGHHLVDAFREVMDTVIAKSDPPPKITFNWVPAHISIEGNELANQAAKRASQKKRLTRKSKLPHHLQSPLPRSLSAIRQAFNKALKIRARKHWRNSPRFARTRSIDPKMPSKHFLDATRGFSRKQTGLIIQLRTGNIPLQKNLHRMRCVHQQNVRRHLRQLEPLDKLSSYPSCREF